MGFKSRGAKDFKGAHFKPELFGFLIEIEQNNDRQWFQENKEFYERAVKEPMLQFIEDFAPSLAKVSKNFQANARSMFRIYRDVRFSKDKRPYKTHAAAHFRHVAGKDAHSIGFYLHIKPGEIFVGSGVWKPDGEATAAIRRHIADHPERWQSVLNARSFRENCRLGGESLKRMPRGFDAEHPCIEDIKRKSFFALFELDDGDVLAPDFVARFTQAIKVVAPLNRFLCEALQVPF
jgi:uncharacterized protein (TIGR02453 family)